jgi:putative sensory transduction regulator
MLANSWLGRQPTAWLFVARENICEERLNFVGVVGVLLVTSGAIGQAQSPPDLEPLDRVVQLLEDSGYRYTKQRSWLWAVVFAGKQMPSVSVWIMAANNELIIQGVVALHDQVVSAPDVMRRLLTMNGNGAGPAFLIDDDGHYVARSRFVLDELDETVFKSSLQAIVAATDAAYGAIKPFLSDHTAARTGSTTTAFGMPSGAIQHVPILNGKAFVSFNPGKWKETRSAEAGKRTFQHANGEGYAMVVAEPIEIPTEQLRNIALANMRKTGTDISVVDEQRRRVNGTDVLLLRTDLTVQGMPFTYFGYYYGGPSGTVQVITYTGRRLFENYRTEFEEFLNGFRVEP